MQNLVWANAGQISRLRQKLLLDSCSEEQGESSSVNDVYHVLADVE